MAGGTCRTLLLAFAVGQLLATVKAASANTTLTIGMYGPLSAPWAVPQLVAAVLADFDFRKYHDPAVRARFRMPMPSAPNGSVPLPPGITIPKVHPDLRVKLVIGDDGEQVNNGVKTALGFVSGPDGRPTVNAVLGGYYSEIAKPVASLCSTLEVVNIAYGAQASEFSNKDLYPYFFRPGPAESASAGVVWAYIKKYQWRTAVALYADEAFGQAYYNSLVASAQREGRAGSISGVGMKAMTKTFDPEVARAAIQRVKLTKTRLVIIIIGGTLEVNTRNVMRQENLTSPAYQFVSSHSTTASVTLGDHYRDFPGWHTSNGYIAPSRPLQVVFSMWPQLRPSDILDNIQAYGIDKWVVPFNNKTLTPALFSGLPMVSAAIVALVYNAYYALVFAFNDMLNAGYTAPDIQGPLLRRFLQNVTFEAVALNVKFDKNQDGAANWTMQYLGSAATGQPVTWVNFDLYLDSNQVLGSMATSPDGPRWATGDFAKRAPQVLAGCPPGTYLDVAANAGVGACAQCAEGRISTGYDSLECQRCPSGTREIDRLTCAVCEAGSASPEGSYLCALCEAGSSSDKAGQSRCSQCGLGHFQATSGQTACIECSAGFIADSPGMVECTPCPRGHFQSNSRGVECSRCLKGTFASRTGSSACDRCSYGTETEGVGALSPDECVCAAGSFLPVGGVGCEKCPDGMECKLGSRAANLLEIATQGTTTGEYPKLLPGYWSAWSEPLSVFKCKSSVHCPGVQPETCGDGLVDRSCAVCERAYYWEGNKCTRCLNVETSAWVFPIVPILLCPVLLLILYRFFGDTQERWGSWQNGFSALCFVLLNHYQIVDLVKNSGARAPATMSAIFQGFSFTVDLVGIFKMNCAGFGGFEAGLLVRICAPAILLAVALILYGLSEALARAFRRNVLSLDFNRLNNVYMSLIFTFFTAISAISLALFKCSPNPNGRRTLVADLGIICYDNGRWMRMLAFAVVAVLVYCVGVGALFVRLVLVAPERFATRGFAARWKFLFIRYRPDVYWWSITFLAKNLALNLGFVVYEMALSQLYHAMGVIMLYMTLVFVFVPYRHRVINMAEVVVCLTLILCSSMMTSFVDDSDAQLQVSYAASVVVFMPLVLAPFAGIQLLSHKLCRAREEEKEVNLQIALAELAQATSLLEGTDMRSFLQGLSEWDRWYLERVCDMFQTELLEKKSGTKRWRSSTRNYASDIDLARQRSQRSVSSGSPPDPQEGQADLKPAMQKVLSEACQTSAQDQSEPEWVEEETKVHMFHRQRVEDTKASSARSPSGANHRSNRL